MTKSIYEIDMMRKELRELAEIQNLGIGPQARKSLHDRMLTVAFQLQEATA